MTRLPAEARHGFGGGAIDRSKPLTFRLNGRRLDAFAGDSVLSAAVAGGIVGLGLRHGQTIALDERTAPAVAHRGTANDILRSLPMDRIPALPGLDLVTIGGRVGPMAPTSLLGQLRDRLFGPGTTLNLRLDEADDLEHPWRSLPASATVTTGVLVVGAGVAGMSAAIAASRAGEEVILVERRPELGGDARYFGPVGDDEAPDAAIVRLSAALEKAGVTVHLRAETLALSGTTARVHIVDTSGDTVAGRTIVIQARRVVLATGTTERLPVFAGNRLPGVGGAIAAFHLAERYGIWPGRTALFNTSTNYAYRLALLAADVGVRVPRITDARVGVASRFVDFAKASGITLAQGLGPRSARTAARGSGLTVDLSGTIEGVQLASETVDTDRLVAAGGLQPELTLWLAAGGRSKWSEATGSIEADGRLDDIALAGSAAGYRGSEACMASGGAAVAGLLRKPAVEIVDPQIDAIYESPDGPLVAITARVQDRGHAFLDGGLSFTQRPAPGPRETVVLTAAAGQTPSLGDLAAAVQLGAIPADEAGAVAEERCTIGDDLSDSGWRVPAAPPQPSPPVVPAYLNGRFGPSPSIVHLMAVDERYFESGCLVFASSTETNPLAAAGVVISGAADGLSGGLALVEKASASKPLFVRDTSGAVAVRVAEGAAKSGTSPSG